MMESKKNDVVEQRSYLSDDLIIHEILTRLPVKSILRFKSVSKLWYSTLSSSKFATFQLMKFPLFHPCAPVNTLFIEKQRKFYLFSFDDDRIPYNLEDNMVKLDVDFGVKDYLQFTGCCNGLICLSHSEYFFLLNPATRKIHKYASDGYLEGIFSPTLAATGFGYASSIDDYKYVQILTPCWGSEQARNIVRVFSLRENKWRKIEFDRDDVCLSGKPPVFLNEKLYWFSYVLDVGPAIVCFDLGLEKFDIINSNLLRFCYLRLMGARLSEMKYDSTDRGAELMKQILGSSIMEKSIDLPKEIILDVDSDMIGYTRTGNFFVTGRMSVGIGERVPWGHSMLWLVDTSMKSMLVKSNNERLNIARYVPSLVSPFPIELSEA